MFYAVYENGAIEMKFSFEELHKSEHILFYVKSHIDQSYKYYSLLNAKCETEPLALNGGKLYGIIQRDNCGRYSLEFDIETPSKGIERVEVYRQEGFYFPPLYIASLIIRNIDSENFALCKG